MSIDQEMNLVIAGTGPDGKPCFLERGAAQVSHTPGVVEVAFLWGIDGTPITNLNRFQTQSKLFISTLTLTAGQMKL